ncbi:MAG: HAD-IA family hydrolase [Gammaproteobacteria bacterium]
MNIKAVIFDWDGTVVDSVEHITNSLHQAAAELGFPTLEKAAYRDIIGLGMVDALRRLYPGLQAPDIETIRQAYSRHFFARETTAQQIFTGMSELINSLGERGIGRAVATGKSRRGLDAALHSSGLQAHFDVTRCADETRSKPDPLMLKEILAHFDIDVRDAVMIGDTTYDLEMAERIGMPSIGVRWGVHDDDALAQHSPLALVSTVDELQQILARL